VCVCVIHLPSREYFHANYGRQTNERKNDGIEQFCLLFSLSLSLSPFAGSLRREKKESVEEKTDKSNDDEKIMT
jgi:hypothetical protein